jgi:hypothetical protein
MAERLGQPSEEQDIFGRSLQPVNRNEMVGVPMRIN